jgi:HEAT repeat protein
LEKEIAAQSAGNYVTRWPIMRLQKATGTLEAETEPILKEMSITVRLFGLYPPNHPVPNEALERLYGKIDSLLKKNEDLRLEVSKEKISVFGESIAEGNQQVKNLSFHLFSRGISAILLKKNVSIEELKIFFSVLIEKPEFCRGNLTESLQENEVKNIEIEQLALNTIDIRSASDIAVEEDEKNLDLDALYDLLKSGDIPYSLRRRVLVFFRGNPGQIASLLSGLSVKASFEAKNYTINHRSKFIHELLENLDSLISEEPDPSRESYYKNLASAQLKLDEPLQRELFGSWILPESEDKKSLAAKMVRYIGDTELTDLVLSQITGGENAEKMLQLLQSILLSQQERTNFISLLKDELQKIRYGDHDLLSVLGMKSYLRINATLDDEPEEDETIEISLHYVPEKLKEDEEQEITREVNLQIRESMLQTHFCQTLLEVISQEEEEEQQRKVGEILVDSVNQILDDQRYADAAKILFSLTELRSQSSAGTRALIDLFMEKITRRQMERLINLLSEGVDSQEERQVEECLKLLGSPAVNMLLDALASEEEMKRRRIICQALENVGQNSIDALASKIEGSEWYLVRNIVSIMGRAKNLKAADYLAKTITHSDSRVRSETISAVAGIKGSRASSLLVQALKDPDLKLASKAAKYLGARKAEEAVSELIKIASKFDPLGKSHELKIAAIESLGRIGSPTPLSFLKKLSRHKSFFNASRAAILSQEASRACCLIEKAVLERDKDADVS